MELRSSRRIQIAKLQLSAWGGTDTNGDGFADLLCTAAGGGSATGIVYGGQTESIPAIQASRTALGQCSNASAIDFTWIGQSTAAASVKEVFPQVYDFSISEWRNLISNSSTAANAPITLSSSWEGGVEDLRDQDQTTYFRVYQEKGV